MLASNIKVCFQSSVVCRVWYTYQSGFSRETESIGYIFIFIFIFIVIFIPREIWRERD